MLKEFNDEQMYHQAREQAEPEFAALLKKHGFEEVKQGSRLDDFQHKDIVGVKNGVEWTFDVKDISPKYAGKTSNYNISTSMMDDVKKHEDKYKRHMIACRLYSSDGKATGKYACFRTLEVIKKATMHHKRDDASKKFWLFNVEQCMKEMNSKQWRLLS